MSYFLGLNNTINEKGCFNSEHPDCKNCKFSCFGIESCFISIASNRPAEIDRIFNIKYKNKSFYDFFPQDDEIIIKDEDFDIFSEIIDKILQIGMETPNEQNKSIIRILKSIKSIIDKAKSLKIGIEVSN